jgi:hypothetical protein
MDAELQNEPNSIDRSGRNYQAPSDRVHRRERRRTRGAATKAAPEEGLAPRGSANERPVAELDQLTRKVANWQNEPKFDSDFNRRGKINRDANGNSHGAGSSRIQRVQRPERRRHRRAATKSGSCTKEKFEGSEAKAL